jgi:hypothetical protein
LLNAEKPFTTRVMVALVGNTESRDATTSRVPSHVPPVIKMVGGSSHGHTIHMSKKRSSEGKSRDGVTKLTIERRARQTHFMKFEVQGMKSTSTGIHSIHRSMEATEAWRKGMSEQGRSADARP